MAQLLFCVAKSRPKYCNKGSNICCCVCDTREECIANKPKSIHTVHLNPCDVDENTPNDPCEFSI